MLKRDFVTIEGDAELASRNDGVRKLLARLSRVGVRSDADVSARMGLRKDGSFDWLRVQTHDVEPELDGWWEDVGTAGRHASAMLAAYKRFGASDSVGYREATVDEMLAIPGVGVH